MTDLNNLQPSDNTESRSRVNDIDFAIREKIDRSRFKEGLNEKMAMEIIQWTCDKYSESVESEEDASEEHFQDEMNAYMEMLKDAFYK